MLQQIKQLFKKNTKDTPNASIMLTVDKEQNLGIKMECEKDQEASLAALIYQIISGELRDTFNNIVLEATLSDNEEEKRQAFLLALGVNACLEDLDVDDLEEEPLIKPSEVYKKSEL